MYAETLVGGFFFFSRFFFFFWGRTSTGDSSNTKLPAARKKFTSELPSSDVSTSNRVVASSGSGEMVGREVADNDEFTQMKRSYQQQPAEKNVHERPSATSLVNYPSAELHRNIFDFKMV